MLGSSKLLSLALLVSSVLAAPSGGGVQRKAPSIIPSDWKQLGSSAGSTPLEFTFVLKSAQSEDALTQRMESIAASKSAWLTDEELATFIAPSAESRAALDAAIKSFGASVVSQSPSGDQVTVQSTVAQASKFFGADFKSYKWTGSANTLHRTLSYTIPASIAGAVNDVYPIATFGSFRRVGKVEKLGHVERAVPSQCNTNLVTPSCYRALYQYDTYKPTTSTGSPRTGILAYIGQNYSPTDLATWINTYRPDAKGYSIAVNTSNGATNDPSNPGIEAALDTQTIAGITYPLPSTFYDIGTVNTTGDIFLLTFQNFINTKSGRPQVITISYGSEEHYFTASQANTMCNAAKQLSSLGTTIVVSSGDSGVDGNGGTTCPPFVPTYPGGCPYVLSVGATQKFGPEVMVDTTLAGFYSGAGFSNLFPTPSYQSTVVAAYIKSLNGKYNGEYNKSGRAFPDVSAQGSRQPVVAKGTTYAVGGTSASAPIVAGGLTLLNDLLLKAGKASTGWINPTLYSNSGAFTDVTSGGSFDCGSTSDGLPAGTGWDASAGLGTPLFTKLRAAYGV